MPEKKKYDYNKKRYWSTIVYPESIKVNWIDLLKESGLKCAISPLHDKDLNEIGELKKAHYHLLYVYNGPTTEIRAKKIVELIGSVGCERVENVKGYYDYLTHKNDLDKYQYDSNDIKLINGFNILDFADRTTVESVKLKMALVKYCREYLIYDYKQLCNRLIDEENFDLFDCASENAYFICQYIKK